MYLRASSWVRLAQARSGAASEDVSAGLALPGTVVTWFGTCFPVLPPREVQSPAASSPGTTPMRPRPRARRVTTPDITDSPGPYRSPTRRGAKLRWWHGRAVADRPVLGVRGPGRRQLASSRISVRFFLPVSAFWAGPGAVLIPPTSWHSAGTALGGQALAGYCLSAV